MGEGWCSPFLFGMISRLTCDGWILPFQLKLLRVFQVCDAGLATAARAIQRMLERFIGIRLSSTRISSTAKLAQRFQAVAGDAWLHLCTFERATARLIICYVADESPRWCAEAMQHTQCKCIVNMYRLHG